MKTIGKILIALLVIGLLILLGYAAYRFVLPHWVALLFYTYCILGVLNMTAGLILVLVNNRHLNWSDLLIVALAKVNEPSDITSRFNRFRDLVAGVALFIVSLVAWPIEATYGLILSRRNKDRKLTNQDLALLVATNIPETYKSIFSLCVVLSVFALGFLHADLKIYGILTLALMVASASFRHINYAVGTTSLPAKLRRFESNTFVMFLIVVVADFSTLVLGLNAIESHGKWSSITWPSLVATGRQLYQGEGALWTILRGANPTVSQIVIAFVGLLFNLALLKVLFRDFWRNDEDYTWLAITANTLGNFSIALRYLRKVKTWTQRSRSIEIVSLLGVNQIEEAATQAESLLVLLRTPSDENAVFANLINACLSPRMPHAVYLDVLQRGIDANVSDAWMQDCVGLVAQNQLQDAALAKFSKVAPSYPLTIARIHMLVNQFDQAAAAVETYPPTADLDRFVALVVALTVHLSDQTTTRQQDAQTFAAFADEAIPLIHKLLKSPLEHWQRIIFYTEIHRTIYLARTFAENRVEEFQHLSDKIADQQKDDEFKRVVALVQSQFKNPAVQPR